MRLRTLATIGLVVLCAARGASAQQTMIFAPSTVSGVVNNTVTVNTVLLPFGAQSLDILLKITAGGTATGTLQLWLEDSCDGGTTWDDLASSLTFALGAATVNQRLFVSGLLQSSTVTTAALTATTQGSANQVEAMAAGSARQGPFCDRLRLREKISGVSGSPAGATYTITAVVR